MKTVFSTNGAGTTGLLHAEVNLDTDLISIKIMNS